ncbi:type II restriction endonuclease, Eco47II family [Campylobacter pinnipediorum subsp. caledonicus]|uniref:Type II restriction endonuclease, Eco47II family n=1 Tax=Campylobacter pinnipediorum subsp. caledonicus TaxID=1874362 RepID=A0A1S6U610_9BACT|nr:Eco47II family restriction endonuclease [Campylobacter pinnipediorum]AQW85280.1 type II restriction endonuclease, Eco47II family [Campylobacter pinnipediorum subsp. caledonicus]AQW86887.1 type II restriction endonuclease, Eco47II family [Campylobacter pinnipediorum subsp. caledonicus]OPA71212.1 restriction endonuclease [Campylobacter pinnipediorum subsp. caledonicus]
MNEYILEFISENDFERHLEQTIKEYNQVLKSVNLKKFNSNIIDPIKLLFDKNVFNKSYEDIIRLEIQRQRDKSNNNIIGYFHQNIFKYFNCCEVPEEYWDVIYKPNCGDTYYVEIKNKHNTMNSSSSAKTYMKFQNHLLTSDDRGNSICALVEIIAKESQDKEWVIAIDKSKQNPNARLRRISIDKFYEIVTGDKEAFKKLCIQLPITIEKIISEQETLQAQEDTVIEELLEIDKNTLMALYKLAFKTYEGF